MINIMNRIDETTIKNALVKIKPGLQKYLYIQDSVLKTDVSQSVKFKQTFNGFYRIRQRPEQFYATFYGFMEENKFHSPTFEQTLRFFHEKLNRIEASFSSKLVATLNPNLPIWDSVVLANFELKAPAYYRKNRLHETIMIYEEIQNRYREIQETELALLMIELFDQTYPDSGITDMKKIDFIIWQIRD